MEDVCGYIANEANLEMWSVFLVFDFCRFRVVIRFFHPRHNGQWAPTSKDFLSQMLSILIHLCTYLKSWSVKCQDFQFVDELAWTFFLELTRTVNYSYMAVWHLCFILYYNKCLTYLDCKSWITDVLFIWVALYSSVQRLISHLARTLHYIYVQLEQL